FGKASLGRRGYDQEQVDTLLDEAIREMISLLDENNTLPNALGGAEPPPRSNGRERVAAAQSSALAADLVRTKLACERAQHQARLTRLQLDTARRTDRARGPP